MYDDGTRQERFSLVFIPLEQHFIYIFLINKFVYWAVINVLSQLP